MQYHGPKIWKSDVYTRWKLGKVFVIIFRIQQHLHTEQRRCWRNGQGFKSWTHRTSHALIEEARMIIKRRRLQRHNDRMTEQQQKTGTGASCCRKDVLKQDLDFQKESATQRKASGYRQTTKFPKGKFTAHFHYWNVIEKNCALSQTPTEETYSVQECITQPKIQAHSLWWVCLIRGFYFPTENNI